MFQTHEKLNPSPLTYSFGDANFSEDKNIGTAVSQSGYSGSFAIIDIGSNSCRLCVFKASALGGFCGDIRDDIKCTNNHGGILHEKIVETTQLGEGFSADLTIQKNAFNRTITALKSFVEIASKNGVSKIFAFATATVREAKNRAEFLSACLEFGLEIHILSGDEEALCGFLGVAVGSLVPPDKDICIFDIGGASFEIAVGNMQNFAPLFPDCKNFPTHAEIIEKSKGTLKELSTFPLKFSHSFKIGAVRAKDMFACDFTSLSAHLRDIFASANLDLKLDSTLCFGIGGTITSLAGLINHSTNFHPSLHGFSCSIREINSLALSLQAMTDPELQNLPFLKDKRKAIIPVGSEILRSAMAFFGANSISASLTDNIEGYKRYLGL